MIPIWGEYYPAKIKFRGAIKGGTILRDVEYPQCIPPYCKSATCDSKRILLSNDMALKTITPILLIIGVRYLDVYPTAVLDISSGLVQSYI